MRYLLDTCVISDFTKNEKNTVNQIKGKQSFEIAISSITLMEIHFGLQLNPGKAKLIEKTINDLLTSITILSFSQSDAIAVAKIRSFLKKQGTPIGSYDSLIAGTAINHQLILVSSNLKEFTRIKELQIENWRSPITESRSQLTEIY